MNESRRKQMRGWHAVHTHPCYCGKVSRGNGGWASHRWSCRVYQTIKHDTLDRFDHNPKRCHICPA